MFIWGFLKDDDDNILACVETWDKIVIELYYDDDILACVETWDKIVIELYYDDDDIFGLCWNLR